MRQLDLHTSTAHLRVLEHLRQIVDRPHRNAERLQQLNPIRNRTLLQHCRHHRHEHLAMAHSILVATEARVEMKCLYGSPAKLFELTIATHPSNELTIGGVEHLIGN